MYQEKFDALMDEFSYDPEAREAFLSNPVPVLREAGIPVVSVWEHGDDFEEGIHNVSKYMAGASAPALSSIQVPEMAEAPAEAAPVARAAAAGEHIEAHTYWWGVDIVMNEKLTQDVIEGVTATGALGGLIASAIGAAGVVTGGVAAVIGAGLAAAFALKIAEIKIINNGNGVHWPITWVQWAALAASVPAGPAGIVTAAMVFLHPVRN